MLVSTETYQILKECELKYSTVLYHFRPPRRLPFKIRQDHPDSKYYIFPTRLGRIHKYHEETRNLVAMIGDIRYKKCHNLYIKGDPVGKLGPLCCRLESQIIAGLMYIQDYKASNYPEMYSYHRWDNPQLEEGPQKAWEDVSSRFEELSING